MQLHFVTWILLWVVLVSPVQAMAVSASAGHALGDPLQTIRINLGAMPTTLDPIYAEDAVNIEVVTQLFSGLTRQDEESGAIVPDLAESWTVAPDGRSITFYLRSGLLWSDGVSITASEVVLALQRAWQFGAYGSFMFSSIGVDGFSVVGQNGVRVSLSEANAGVVPSIMALIYPVPEHAISALGASWAEPGNIVTSGPYRSAGSSWQPLVLEKNPQYHDASAVAIERVEFYTYADATAATQLYARGDLDATYNYDSAMVNADPDLMDERSSTSSTCNYYYGFTTTKPPLDNPLLRKALIAAIDRATLVASAVGAGVPSTTFAPPGIFGAVPPGSGVGIDYNPAQAQAWLAQSGVSLPFTLRLAFPTRPGYVPEVAQYIADSWETILGIDAVIESLPWGDYLQLIQPTTPVEQIPHVWALRWCTDYNHQHDWVHTVFNSQAGTNYIRWHSAEFDTITSQAAASGDPAQQATWYRRAEEILNEDQAGILSLYWSTRSQLSKPYVQRTFAHVWGEQVRNWSFLPGSGVATAAGGSVQSADGRTEADFPPDAFSTDVDLLLDHLTVLPGSAGTRLSANRTFQLRSLDAGSGNPVSLDPLHPAMLTMQYTDQEKGAIIESTLRLYRWNGSAWQQISATFDYANNTVSAPLPQLGVFALLGDTHRIWLPTLIHHSP
jgi:ABC-type oligopeptide transport system substrate-binding subunit